MASNLTEYLVLFYVYSLLGWCMEMVYCGIREHRLVNRGFLLGPCCPIYGVGMVTITVLFQHARFGFAAVFVMIIVFCTALEYAASVVMEHFFHTRWWDYNDMKFNIHGRVCMETMLPFGLLGCYALYRVNPFFLQLYHTVPYSISRKIVIGLVLMTLIDLLVSVSVLHGLSRPEGEADHTAEISRRVREKIMKRFG